jgi:hypothetical protein
MLRMIAYGSELNLVHPPRPADPKIAWEPQWAAKIRVKSIANAILGMDMPAMPRDTAGQPGQPADQPPPAAKKEEEKPLDPVNILRGILGR